MTRSYLDASVALHAILPAGDSRARAWLEEAGSKGDSLLSSTLFQLEIVRTLRREQLDIRFADAVLRRVNLVSIDDAVLEVAGGLEPHVKTLDAIHLATCLMLGPNVTLVTHDATMVAAATALGIDAMDPLADSRTR